MDKIDYGDFSSRRFDSFDSGFDEQINKGNFDEQINKGNIDEQINKGNIDNAPSKKIKLGIKLLRIEKSSPKTIWKEFISFFSQIKLEEYALKRADKYISIKREIPLRKAVNEYGTCDEEIEGLFQQLKKPKGDYHEISLQILLEVMNKQAIAPPQDSGANISTTDKTHAAFHKIISPSQRANTAMLFHLHVTPNVDKTEQIFYSKRNQDNLQLVEQHLPADKMPTISAQARKFPIMQTAVVEIRENLEELDACIANNDSAGKKLTRTRLENQLENLAALSDAIADATQSSEDSAALSSLSMLSLTSPETSSRYGAVLDQAIKGDLKVTPELISQIHKISIQKTIIQQKKASPAHITTTKELTERRAEAVTTRAIQLQAELHQAIRKGKGWAATQSSIAPQGNSVNEVFKLRGPGPNETAAFFKVGRGGEEAAGTMEKLMWDIAVIMGLEDQFAPTGETELRDKSQLTGGSESAMQWDASGELQKLEEAKAPRRGGVQVAQKGRVLDDLLDAGKASNLDTAEVSKATLASLVFGMFDAHSKNIFVTDEGKIKFFDNTRSMPNSNGFVIRTGEDLVSSYRSILMDLPQSKKELSNEQIKQLKSDVAAYEEKVDKLRKYLTSPQGKALLKKLPVGWMDLEKSLGALEERVNNMKKALDSGNVKTLQDLVTQTMPNYKLAYGLTHLHKIYTEKNPHKAYDTTFLNNDVGYYKTNITLKLLENSGVDVQLLQKWCDDPSVSLAQLTRNIDRHVAQLLNYKQTDSEIEARRQATVRLQRELMGKASIDFKDLERSQCVQQAALINLNKIHTHWIAWQTVRYLPNDIQLIDFMRKGIENRQLFSTIDGRQSKAVCKTPTGYRVKTIDIGSSLGKVIAGKREMTVADFANHFRDPPEVPEFDELPILDNPWTEYLCNESPGGLLLRKSQDNKSLVIAIKRADGTVKQFKFAPGKDGKFQDQTDTGEVQEFTIEEIIPRARQKASSA